MQITVNEKGLPELDQLSKEGFVDCVFKIDQKEETSHSYRLQLRAVIEGREVGLEAEVVKGMQPALDKDMEIIPEHVYWQGVRLKRSGEESDRFLTMLNTLYNLGEERLVMKREETYTALALNEEPFDMEREPVRLKIFGCDGEEDDECKFQLKTIPHFS